MSKKTPLLSAVSISFCVIAASAEAKLIRYEINGQTYSYSTNNRQQTKEARARIEAAAAADAAKTRAEAERAANPLAKIFGSPAQQAAAADAQTRAQQAAPAEPQTDIASTSSLRHSRRGTRRSAGQASARDTDRQERKHALRAARLDRQRSARETRLEQQRTARAARAQKLAARTAVIPTERARKEPETTSSIRQPVTALSSAPAAPTSAPVSIAPLKDAHGDSLTDFVNQVRKAPTGDGAPRL